MIKLFKHQEDVLKQTEDLNKVAYYLDMGLGKTFVGSEKMIQLDSKVNLVICQKSKIDDWVEHFEKYYPNSIVDNLTTKNGMKHFFEMKWQAENIVPIENIVPLVGVINYELAWRRKELEKLKDFTLMLDESSLIQNSKAKQTKFIINKLQAKNIILLSGTPCSGKYENLWTQAKLLGWGITEKLFLDQYVNFKKIDVGGVPIKIVDKRRPYKNQERLKSKFKDYGAVFMKTDEVFDLPEQNFTKIKVPTTEAYEKFKKEFYVDITLNGCIFEDESDFYGNDATLHVELVGNTTLTQMLYLRQLCGQYNMEKFNALKDLLESTNDRVIVFYNFNDELDRLIQVCESLKKPISQVNGHVKDLKAYENEENSVTLCQYQAASKGLNLQKANKLVYFTPTLSVENYMQSQKRIHRIGQNKPCFYYQLICKGSIEQDIYKALERGVDFTDKLFISSCAKQP